MAPLRRYNLDWLRIGAVFLLVPFHSALIFALSSMYVVYIKDIVESRPLIAFATFLNLWHMPLLFVIAGASTWMALRKRSGGQYLKERVQRLLEPAVFGILTLIPLMTYTHLLAQPDPPNFWSYYRGFFQVNPRDMAGLSGTFTPAHLWFIVYLFIYSAAGLPLFLWLRGETGGKLIAKIGSIFTRPGLLIVLFIPILLASAVPLLGDKNPISYFVIFLLGVLLISSEPIQSTVNRDWPLYGGLGVASTIGYFIMNSSGAGAAPSLSTIWVLYGVVFTFTRWVWVIAILGAGHRWLNSNSPALKYLSEAAFPFYILHLPVDTLVGLWVIHLPLTIGIKYTLIVVLTILITGLIYELVVRRLGALRFLFGVKQAKAAASNTASTVTAQT